MSNNVVESIWRYLPNLGILSLRFNFRGVGTSEGRFENGRGEIEDLLGAIQFLKGFTSKSLPLFFIGYSFGTHVIHLSEPLPETTTGVVFVSPPLSMMKFELSRFNPSRPYLILTGDRDPFCPRETIEPWGSRSKNITLKIAKNTDHFWYGKEAFLTKEFELWSNPLLKDVLS